MYNFMYIARKGQTPYLLFNDINKNKYLHNIANNEGSTAKLESHDFRRYLILSVAHYSMKKKKRKKKRYRRKHQGPSLVMVMSGVRLAVRVSVRIFPTGRAAAGRPSTGNGSRISTADGTIPSTR